MKTVKRIVAIVLVIVTAVAVGYLVFTGNRLTVGSEHTTAYLSERCLWIKEEFFIYARPQR